MTSTNNPVDDVRKKKKERKYIESSRSIHSMQDICIDEVKVIIIIPQNIHANNIFAYIPPSSPLNMVDVSNYYQRVLE